MQAILNRVFHQFLDAVRLLDRADKLTYDKLESSAFGLKKGRVEEGVFRARVWQ